MPQHSDFISSFLQQACVPTDQAHASGTLDAAESLLAQNPELASANIFTAAVLGHPVSVRSFLQSDPSLATTQGGPHHWDALTHLCFSRYLRLHPHRSDDFVQSAKLLLEAGANPNTGWHESEHQPHPVWESVLYGAAGVAHHPALTQLLLDHGADPNDDEVPYHAPEDGDNRVTRILLQSGKLKPSSLTTMLIRKADCHDAEGLQLLLQHGADPNELSIWGVTGLHQSIRRDNAIRMIDMLLDHGADPGVPMRGTEITGFMIAARRGRGDFLSRLQERGRALQLTGIDQILAACAMNQADKALQLWEQLAEHRSDLIRMGGQWLAQFAGNDNVSGVQCLLGLGLPVDSLHEEGDGYFDIAPRSTALHVACWRAQHATVKLLLDRGAHILARDGRGRTPLMLAIKACVDSYWTYRKSFESITLLLEGGASVIDIQQSTGDPDLDALLKSHGATL